MPRFPKDFPSSTIRSKRMLHKEKLTKSLKKLFAVKKYTPGISAYLLHQKTNGFSRFSKGDDDLHGSEWPLKAP